MDKNSFFLRRIRRLGLLLAGCLFVAALAAQSASAATQHGPNFTVNSLADTDDGSCDDLGQGTGNHDCTLREAINAANAYNNNAVIGFSVSGTITVGSALPNITTSCRIDGAGQKITVSGNNAVGIFKVNYGFLTTDGYGAYTVAFNALTIANSGSTAMSTSGVSLLLTNCLFRDNHGGSGGALSIGLSSTTVIANCTFTENSADTGGAIFAASQYSPNHFYDVVYIYSTTFYNNHATFQTGQFQLAAADIYSVGATAVELRNTLLVNTDNRGMDQEDNAQGITYADHSVICNVDIDSQTFNATQATAAQINLDTLKDNGGPTQTVALLPGSVAINAGFNSAATGAPVNNQDQRGYVRVRPGDATCDVGAYERGASGSLVVTTAADLTAAADGQNSLRTAIAYAQQLGGVQTITFAAPLAGQTLALSNAWDNANGYNSSSAFRIDSNITVQGPSAAPGITLKVADPAQLRHFVISSAGNLTLQNLTLTGGKPALPGFAAGGAIWNFGSVALRNCTLTGNATASEGGAIQSWGDSTSLLIENSTITGNQAATRGGAIVTGAISATLRYVTISNNTSPDGSAFVLFKYPVTMINGLIGGSGNEGVIPDAGGVFSASSTNNIFTSATAPGLTNGTNGNKTGIPAAQLKLSSLASNGGPTQTIALQLGSAAVDAGVAIAGMTTDQVGTSRPQGNAPDAGAFEFVPTLFPGLFTGIYSPGGDGTAWLIGYPGGTLPSLALSRNLNPLGAMTFDAAGTLYYAAYDGGSRWTYLYKLAQGSRSPGIIASFFGRLVNAVFLNAAGDALYVVSNGDYYNALGVAVVSPTGAFGQYYAIFTSDLVAGGAAMDSANNLYVADLTNQIIRMYPLSGNSTVFASGVSASGMAFDAHGNLFASTGSNPGNESILKFTPAGARSTFASGLANRPLGLAFDTNGNLFVAEMGADNQSGDILKITPNGTKSTFDSNLGFAYAGGNGGPRYLALFPGVLPTAVPVISPASGTFESSVSVTISSVNPGATIRYTLDGSTPSETNGLIYNGPFTLTQSAAVKAVAYGAGWIISPVASINYTVLPPLPFWRNLQGLPSDGSQDLANPSGDGITNLEKFAFNLAPNAGDLGKPGYQVLSANGTAGLPLITIDGNGRLVVTFVRRKTSTNSGITYVVETGTDLSGLNPLDLTGASVVSIDAIWERVTVVDPVVSSRRFGRVRVYSSAYYNDFNVGLGAATLNGSAVYLNQAVQLTDGVASGQGGSVTFNGINVTSQVTGFTARFNLAINASGVPADGVSFAVGSLPATWGEIGPQTSHSLAVGFDTYDNGGTGGTGVHVWVNGVHLVSDPTNPFTNGAVPVEITYDQSTGLTVKYNGATIFSNVTISGFNFQAGDQFGIGARTGAAVERAVVDNVQITPR